MNMDMTKSLILNRMRRENMMWNGKILFIFEKWVNPSLFFSCRKPALSRAKKHSKTSWYSVRLNHLEIIPPIDLYRFIFLLVLSFVFNTRMFSFPALVSLFSCFIFRFYYYLGSFSLFVRTSRLSQMSFLNSIIFPSKFSIFYLINIMIQIQLLLLVLLKKNCWKKSVFLIALFVRLCMFGEHTLQFKPESYSSIEGNELLAQRQNIFFYFWCVR